MRPLTPEEYDEASAKESQWIYHYTYLPATLVRIHRQRAKAAAKILVWLNDIGCELSYFMRDTEKEIYERLLCTTGFEIKIRHDNDYIECGPATPDPHGHMFHVFTPFTVGIKFSGEDVLAITQQLELFSDKKLEINKKLPHVHLNFYSHERDLHGDSMNFSAKYGIKLAYTLTFDIHHSWGSMYNTDRAAGDDIRAAHRVGEYDNFMKKAQKGKRANRGG